MQISSVKLRKCPPTGGTGQLMKTDSFDMWGGGEYASQPFCIGDKHTSC